MENPVLARDSLKSKQGIQSNNGLFGVLYHFLLYVAIPVAFEISYVKIFQHSMNAYEVNDVVAMGRLIIYFAIQWFLGVLVRRDYLRSGLKRLTLMVMIMVQVKEAFFEEVLVDMVISMVLESGLAALLFLKLAHLMVILQLMGLFLIIFYTVIHVKEIWFSERLRSSFQNLTLSINDHLMQGIQNCKRMHRWHQHRYCCRNHQLSVA